jgi:hypothetical protein
MVRSHYERVLVSSPHEAEWGKSCLSLASVVNAPLFAQALSQLQLLAVGTVATPTADSP